MDGETFSRIENLAAQEQQLHYLFEKLQANEARDRLGTQRELARHNAPAVAALKQFAQSLLKGDFGPKKPSRKVSEVLEELEKSWDRTREPPRLAFIEVDELGDQAVRVYTRIVEWQKQVGEVQTRLDPIPANRLDPQVSERVNGMITRGSSMHTECSQLLDRVAATREELRRLKQDRETAWQFALKCYQEAKAADFSLLKAVYEKYLLLIIYVALNDKTLVAPLAEIVQLLAEDTWSNAMLRHIKTMDHWEPGLWADVKEKLKSAQGRG